MGAAAKFVWTPEDSETELGPLFEYAPVALAQCQRQGNITALNPALEQMLGGKASIAPSLCFADLIHPQDRVAGERLFQELFERQRDSFQIASQMTGTNSRRVRWTAWLVPGTSGRSEYALVLAQDVPQEYEAAQRLCQSEKLETMGRLAGGVAHDFNNLLTGILLYCDLLLAHLEPSHRARNYAEEIRNAGLQAAGLVRQLLAVARPANSGLSQLSLNQVAEGMHNLLRRLIGENIDLQFHLDPNLGLVRIDPTQFQQILLNLVLNARDAMPTGGKITVETSNCKVQVLAALDLAMPVAKPVLVQPALAESGLAEPTLVEPNFVEHNLVEPNLVEPSVAKPDRVPGNPASLPCALFVVTDNGSGMDAATRAHLFEAFFTTKAEKGIGLGLATVYDIVTSNGGLIHVDSAPACGARVSVLLPLVPAGLLNSQHIDAHDFPPATDPEVATPNRQKDEV
jgi:two-component system cell cycle sensor histidine kinase/response regulator CckA